MANNTDKRLIRVNSLVFFDPADSNTSALAFTPMMMLDRRGDGKLFITNQAENGFRTIEDIINDNKYDLIFEDTTYTFFPLTSHLQIEFGYDVTLP